NKFYGVGADTVERLIEDNTIEDPSLSLLDKVDLSDLDQEASIVKFVNQVIWEAYKDRATDIHFEPMEDELRIRYRVDGVLHQTSMPPQLKRFQNQGYGFHGYRRKATSAGRAHRVEYSR
ncbi:ATPase, T2SS/T4P/T4SS family, partial [Verrucomicrobiota bacterium]